MSNENKKPVDSRSAAQKISDLEGAVGQLYNATDLLGRDLSILKNAAKLLDGKLSALVKAVSTGEPVSDEVIDRIMIENNVVDLANRVTNMVVNGVVAPEEAVSDNSFIVGQEINDDGTVANPRLQFARKALAPELQPKLLGLKPGESVRFKEGTLSFKLLESYKINTAPAPEATEESSEQAPEAAAQAPESQPDQSATPSTNP